MNPRRILVAMSGGVDSSVAAALCVEAGYEVIGVSMKLHDNTGQAAEDSCCSMEDFEDARAVAQKLGFPYYVLNMKKQFEKTVVEQFFSEYAAGRTPNPCIHCNDAIKFEALRNKAYELDCGLLATGHYARIVEQDGNYSLLKGIDKTKDQSYFLFTLTQNQMKHIRFPVGGFTKSQVRKKAADLELSVAQKSESLEICFVPDDDYATMFEQNYPHLVRPGNIVDLQGNELGEHQGIHRFTVGQRKGLGIAHSEPLYVLAIRHETSEVLVGTRSQQGENGLMARNMNWTHGQAPEPDTSANVKIRYRHNGVKARLYPTNDGDCEIKFEQPIRAIAPGQAAVAYHEDRVIGGGWIERAIQ